jgi:hypothetical protein
MLRKLYGVAALLLLVGVTGCAPVVVDEGPDLAPTAKIAAICTGCQGFYTGFAPLIVTFDASSSADDHGVIGTFWDFGNGFTAAESKVVQTYTQVGEYKIKLTVIDVRGQKGFAEMTVRVIEKPIEYKIDRGENDFFAMERILEDRDYRSGDVIKIRLKITPKRDLEYSFWQEILPSGLTPDYPRLEFHAYQLKWGQPISWTYEVTVEKPGPFNIDGRGHVAVGPNAMKMRLTTVLETKK